MSCRRRKPILNLFTGLLLASPLVISGCGSTCGTNCPIVAVDINATLGEALNTSGASWTGPACPTTYQPVCWSDDNINPCTSFEIVAAAPGACDLTITFSDGRPTFTEHAVFDQATTQGCCHGFPALVPTTVTIPPLDGGTVSDAAADAGASSDDAGSSDVAGAQ
jgi:hypothetical protein